MASRVEHIAVVTGFPKLSKAHRETAIQALAEILVSDYKANQQVSKCTVKTSTGSNRKREEPPEEPLNEDVR